MRIDEERAADGGVYVSALDLFRVGIGPSSSHTVGPMRAGAEFADRLVRTGAGIVRLEIVLLGSLAATGMGHGTPDAVVAGLLGMQPETCDPDRVAGAWSGHPDGEPLLLGGVLPVPFSRADLVTDPYTRPAGHPNTLILRAWADLDGPPLAEETYRSVGGGFVERDGGPAAATAALGGGFASARELLARCVDGVSVADVALRAELQHRSPAELEAGLDAVWTAMRDCVAAGLEAEGVLPGGLRVRRRAAGLRRTLEAEEAAGRPVGTEWLQAFALAVNEENAAGRRVVTAPTNGAAGIVPAVMLLHARTTDASAAELRTFLLTAAAIGSLLKANASISGAQGGCQAEVGSACAMAAAGLCAVQGGTPAQVENAAEIALEHHLGLTCDPVAGLVQIPCIERNAIAASTAVVAARLALHGDGRHVVPLDAVIETARQTGADMSAKYKETSTGGLAVNVVEC